MINANLHSVSDEADSIKSILRAAVAVTKFKSIYDKGLTWLMSMAFWKFVKLCDDAFADFTS